MYLQSVITMDPNMIQY